MSIYDKNSNQIRNPREIPLPDEGHLHKPVENIFNGEKLKGFL